MRLIRRISADCILLKELTSYTKHPCFNQGTVRHSFLDNILGSVITCIKQTLYDEPRLITENDIIESFDCLELGNVTASVIFTEQELQEMVGILNLIMLDLTDVVVMDCTIANTTVVVNKINNSLLDLFIYDISPIQTKGVNQ